MPIAPGKAGVRAEMEKFKAGQLHSGSKQGPKVTNPKQAIAIALSEQRKAGGGLPPPRPKRRKMPDLASAAVEKTPDKQGRY